MATTQGGGGDGGGVILGEDEVDVCGGGVPGGEGVDERRGKAGVGVVGVLLASAFARRNLLSDMNFRTVSYGRSVFPDSQSFRGRSPLKPSSSNLSQSTASRWISSGVQLDRLALGASACS